MKNITIVRRPDGFVNICIGDVVLTMKKQYWEFLDKLIENFIWTWKVLALYSEKMALFIYA